MSHPCPSRDATGAGRFGDDARALLLDLLIWRRDVRRFRRDALVAGTLERLVKIACLAPSVGLSQPWRFVLVGSPHRRDAVRASFERCNAAALQDQSGERASLYARLKLAGLDDAPCQFAVFADHAAGQGHGLGRATMPLTVDYSAVMAVHTLWLAARAEGIGIGWVSILEPDVVVAALDVPPEWAFVGYFCMGYPVEEDDTPALERAGWEKPMRSLRRAFCPIGPHDRATLPPNGLPVSPTASICLLHSGMTGEIVTG